MCAATQNSGSLQQEQHNSPSVASSVVVTFSVCACTRPTSKRLLQSCMSEASV